MLFCAGLLSSLLHVAVYSKYMLLQPGVIGLQKGEGVPKVIGRDIVSYWYGGGIGNPTLRVEEPISVHHYCFLMTLQMTIETESLFYFILVNLYDYS